MASGLGAGNLVQITDGVNGPLGTAANPVQVFDNAQQGNLAEETGGNLATAADRLADIHKHLAKLAEVGLTILAQLNQLAITLQAQVVPYDKGH